MKVGREALVLIGLVVAGPLDAQVRPQPGFGDPRIQSIDYKADQVVLIEAAPGYEVTIELAPDEKIESAAVGDSATWQVTANHAGNRLFVKPLQSGAETNLTLATNVRVYAFDLTGISNPSANSPYTVQFRYSPIASASAVPVSQPIAGKGRYKVHGARALRPTAIHDDGIHTYIEWPADAALPATYAVDDTGREMLANGNMRDGVYVLDSVAKRLVFRIDKQVALADRLRPRGPR